MVIGSCNLDFTYSSPSTVAVFGWERGYWPERSDIAQDSFTVVTAGIAESRHGNG
jgi:hypothetical protein